MSIAIYSSVLKIAVFVSVDGPTSCREEPNQHKSQVERRDWAISFVDAIKTTLGRLHPSGNLQILREKKAIMEFRSQFHL